VSEEEWRWIPGWEGLYKASSWGRVKSMPRRTKHQLRPGKILAPGLLPTGYANVNLSRNGRPKTHYVHRLVLEAFRGPPPEGMAECLHRDGDPMNNNIGNLAWGTPKDNARDRKRVRGARRVLESHQYHVIEPPRD
jgi:hypothetical protein